ncbi:MAG TPA: KH domain-containing protein [Firmicutes bacterium]|jgi:predicted RNA-binding protein YlqC (UPF0109 family)|nr:KH domain-containing protein [Bacillota bacterium]HOQ24032.1 KH domain-containing protein [Bacillota bacterium]HPT67430.1 KH domain-containing protein [Bacillota bacterium]
MRELVEVLVKMLVDDPSAVSVRKTERNEGVLLEIKVAKEDVGKVIGRQGRVIKAIRTVVRSCAQREGKRVNVELTED